MAAQVLRALEPAALELSLQATQEIQKERERLDRHGRQRLEGARYETERARRQYDAGEPENRLVARTLERRWEEALRQQRQVEEEYDRFAWEQPAGLTEAEQARIRSRSADLPSLWQACGTTVVDRKEVVRCLVQRVVVCARGESNHVGVAIHWKGGFASEHEILRPVQRYEQMDDCAERMDRIKQLRAEGHPAAAIADTLNEEGFSPARRRDSFRAGSVRQLLHRRGLVREGPGEGPSGADEWWLADLSHEVGVAAAKLREWILRGWLRGWQTAGQGRWVAWADREELRRLRELAVCSARGAVTYPKKLTRPKKRKGK